MTALLAHGVSPSAIRTRRAVSVRRSRPRLNSRGRQVPIRQCFGVENAPQGVPEDVRVVPVVEPSLQFFEVAVQVLRADLVERADDGPLEQRPDALDAVRVHVANHSLFSRVVHRLVPGVVIDEPR